MQALIPQPLRILNDSVPENEAPLWDAATTYHSASDEEPRPADRVIYNHYVYECRKENSNKPPDLNSDYDGAAWRTIAVTNKYACIDVYRHTQTIAPEGEMILIIQVPFDRPATGFGLLNMDATSVKVMLKSDDGEVLWGGETHRLLEDTVSLWNYFFDPFRYLQDKTFTNIIPISGVLEIELYGGRPAIGTIVVGEHVLLGLTQYGPRSGFKDYSISTTDQYGNVQYFERKKAKIGTFSVHIPPKDMDYVTQRVTDVGSRPTLWIGDDGVGYPFMAIFGRLKEFDTSLVGFSQGEATFDIEGFV